MRRRRRRRRRREEDERWRSPIMQDDLVLAGNSGDCIFDSRGAPHARRKHARHMHARQTYDRHTHVRI